MVLRARGPGPVEGLEAQTSRGGMTARPLADVGGGSAPIEARLLAPVDPMDWLRKGGPSLGFALAGLGMLVWVVRRTRRRLARAER